jgi:nodulation protein F
MNDELATTVIAKIKAHAAPDAGEITLGTELSDLDIHSLEMTEIVFELEDEFGIEIEMNSIDTWSNMSNVGDIVTAVRELVGKKA